MRPHCAIETSATPAPSNKLIVMKQLDELRPLFRPQSMRQNTGRTRSLARGWSAAWWFLLQACSPASAPTVPEEPPTLAQAKPLSTRSSQKSSPEETTPEETTPHPTEVQDAHQETPANSATSDTLSPKARHRRAMELDLAGKLNSALLLYAQSCDEGYGASCFSIGDLSARCVFTSGYPFFESAQLWLRASCDAGNSRGCFAGYALHYPPDETDRPPWTPHQVQCNQLRATLENRKPPGANAAPRWLPEPPKGPVLK